MCTGIQRSRETGGSARLLGLRCRVTCVAVHEVITEIEQTSVGCWVDYPLVLHPGQRDFSGNEVIGLGCHIDLSNGAGEISRVVFLVYHFVSTYI